MSESPAEQIQPVPGTESGQPGVLTRAILWASAALCLTGLIVRLTVQDSFRFANTIFYATPWAVLTVLAAFTAWGLWRGKGSRTLQGMFLIVMLGCGVQWCRTCWVSHPQSTAEGSVRIITWNLGHGGGGLPELMEALARWKPDLAVLVEADPGDVDVRQVISEAFPEHRVFMLGGGIVMVSRWPGGEATPYEVHTGAVESRIRELDLETPWGKLTVFGCDIGANVTYQRAPHLRELSRLVERRRDHAVIVAGDFNTPLDSLGFGPLRQQGMTEVFESAGAGYVPTWPLPFPVLSLDQIWVSPEVKPVASHRAWNWRSDHAAVITDVILPQSSQ